MMGSLLPQKTIKKTIMEGVEKLQVSLVTMTKADHHKNNMKTALATHNDYRSIHHSRHARPMTVLQYTTPGMQDQWQS